MVENLDMLTLFVQCLDPSHPQIWCMIKPLCFFLHFAVVSTLVPIPCYLISVLWTHVVVVEMFLDFAS